MNSFEKAQLLDEIKRTYDLKIRDLQLQIDSLVNFTDSLMEYTITKAGDQDKAKQEIKALYSNHKGNDRINKYFNQRLS
ncbi:hypothetical protein [Cedecea neteri]|uniref:hypothetical protein n=1 Tax=Cedecea neteri TaxID=158822 RepID=UPI00289D10AF|nr:hypothetical protein [Cedecea neteri]